MKSLSAHIVVEHCV